MCILTYEAILFEKTLRHIHIDPFEIDQLNPNSYDVRLGNWFVPILGYHNGDPVYGDFSFIPVGKRVSIPGGKTILATTLERIGARVNVTAMLEAKSSIARAGLLVAACAGVGDVGYFDQHWTFAISCTTSCFLPALTVGERIGQIIFHKVSSITLHPYSGQYSEDNWPFSMIPKKYRPENPTRIELDGGITVIARGEYQPSRTILPED